VTSFVLRPKYIPQHSIRQNSQSTVLLCERPCFTPIQNNRQNYSYLYLVSHSLPNPAFL
jgi:hypothetical protein